MVTKLCRVTKKLVQLYSFVSDVLCVLDNLCKEPKSESVMKQKYKYYVYS